MALGAILQRGDLGYIFYMCLPMAAPNLVGCLFDGLGDPPDEGAQSTKLASQSAELEEHFFNFVIVELVDQPLLN